MVEGAAYTKSSVRRETRAPGRVAEVRGCGQSEAVVDSQKRLWRWSWAVVAPVVGAKTYSLSQLGIAG